MKIPTWIVKRLEEWQELTMTSKKSRRKRKIEKGRFNVPCLAFDTETLDGYCLLLACSDKSYVLFDRIDRSNVYEILNFLTKSKYKKTLNFFYNVDYDVSAIIKYLPAKNVRELMLFNTTEYDDFQLTYVPRKVFAVKKRKTKFYYYDLWQFYHVSLDKAAQLYLGGKHKDPIDREKLGTSKKYWEENLHDIVKYCIKDCVLTAELAEIMQKKLNAIGLSFDKPYSTGTISIRYASEFYDFPVFKPTQYNLYAYLSYFGGRFEVIQKGYFDYVHVSDINSAYPYQISKLIDVSKGEWIKVSDLDENADVAFYKIVIEKTDDNPIQPFSFRNSGGLVYYPQFKGCLHYTTQDELLFALNNTDTEIKVVDGYAFYAHEIVHPFEKIKEIYEERKRIKNKDQVLQLVLKIIMNSLYGKFAEKTKQIYESDIDNATDFYVNDGKIIPVTQFLKPGRIFNPVYASLITARTRVMLLEQAYKKPDHVVAMFTDSILSTKKFIEESKELGGWDSEGEGEALIVGCGVYTIRNEEKTKTRLRGIHLTNSIDLIQIAERYPNKREIELSWKKTIKPKEALNFVNKYTLDDINYIINYAKKIDARMDRKRKWYENPETFGQLREKSYISEPLSIG